MTLLRFWGSAIVILLFTNAVAACRPPLYPGMFNEVPAPVMCTLCEDSANFVEYITSIPPSRAVLLLTEPILSDGAPPNIIQWRNEIVSIVGHYEREFTFLIQRLRGFKHLDREDLMISALFHLGNVLPDDCPSKSNAISMVNYLVLKKYLRGGNPRNLPGVYPPNFIIEMGDNMMKSPIFPPVGDQQGFVFQGPPNKIMPQPAPIPSVPEIEFSAPPTRFVPGFPDVVFSDQVRQSQFEYIMPGAPDRSIPDFPGMFPVGPVMSTPQEMPNLPNVPDFPGIYPLRPVLSTPQEMPYLPNVPDSPGIFPVGPVVSTPQDMPFLPNVPNFPGMVSLGPVMSTPQEMPYMPNVPDFPGIFPLRPVVSAPQEIQYLPNVPDFPGMFPFAPGVSNVAPFINNIYPQNQLQTDVSRQLELQILNRVVSIIPRPMTQQETRPYNTLITFFKENLPRLLQLVNVNDGMTVEQTVNSIFETIVKYNMNPEVVDIMYTYKLVPHPGLTGFLNILTKEQRYAPLVQYLKSVNWVDHVPSNIVSEQGNNQLQYYLMSNLLLKKIERPVYDSILFYLSQNHPMGLNLVDIFSVLPGFNVYDDSSFNVILSYVTNPENYAIFRDMDLSGVNDTKIVLRLLLQRLAKAPNADVAFIARKYLKQLLIAQTGVDFSVLVAFLPQPLPNEVIQYNILKQYLEGVDIYNIVNIEKLSYADEQDLLNIVLKITQENAPSVQVKEVAHYYLNKVAVQKVNKVVLKLIKLIPVPQNAEEERLHTVVTKFLRSPDAVGALQGIDFSLIDNDQILLDMILKRIAGSQQNVDIQNAFSYYVNLRETLDSVDLITTKEIKKHFKLTDIFLDTLPVDRLLPNQKHAFRCFFKFITQVSQPIMSGFVTWDQARTRGEFMKLLFSYFLQNERVPAEVKVSISILNPLIRMDGRGALPP